MTRSTRTRTRGRRRALGVALTVLASSAALTAVTTAPARAAESTPKPRVVFTEYKDVDGVRTSSIVTVNADGSLWLLGGTGYGDVTNKVRIGTGWKDLRLTGVGDLGNDGIPDVLARDTAGVLWRYDGDGKGGLKSRVKIGWGWNGLNAF
ncbi:hypothetical protein [Streptomyces sp. NPDC005828]|uniref:hypothetical protein n=1 Tax=Streptomyces sp. NPDC005828 TaxID=3157071 RepID=UPI0033D0D27A